MSTRRDNPFRFEQRRAARRRPRPRLRPRAHTRALKWTSALALCVGLAVLFIFAGDVQGMGALKKIRSAVAQLHRMLEQPAAAAHNVAARIEYKGAAYDTYTVDLEHSEVSLHWKDPQGQLFVSIQKLKDYLTQQGHPPSLITNAGIFAPGQVPEGLYVEKSGRKVELNLRDGEGNFYLKPNGVFYIDADGAHIVESSGYQSVDERRVTCATQSGPLLVRNGRIHPAFRPDSKHLNIRSGVGVIGPKKVVFAISDQPVSLFDFAAFFSERLHCANALYLDGAISLMYLPELKRTDTAGQFAGMLAVTNTAK